MAKHQSPEKVLLVDDEAPMLRVYERILGRQFNITTANSGEQGLAKIETEGPFAVICSDLKMPNMDGIEFLTEARKRSCDSVRMVMTAYAEVDSAIELVNKGNVFRFLTKPVESADLISAVASAIDHHRFLAGEREVLELTLRNGVRVLTELLTVVNPKAFRRVNRVSRCVRHLSQAVGLSDAWHFELAATLHELGPAFLPQDTLQKIQTGWPLPQNESEIVSMALDYERKRARQMSHEDAIAEVKRGSYSAELLTAIDTFTPHHTAAPSIPGAEAQAKKAANDR